MSVPILVLYPHRGRFYPQHEVYGRLDGYQCTFSAPDETFARNSRGGMEFQVHQSRPLFGFTPFGAGALEHTRITGLDSVLRRVAPKIVITFEAFSAISYQVSRSRERRRFRHVVLSDSTAPPAGSLWRYAPTTAFFAAEVRRNADCFIAHTARAGSALHFFGITPQRIAHVPPGVDLPPMVDRPPETEDGFRVLFLGALRRNKGVRTLIRAFEQIRRTDRRIRLLVAGSGPLEPEVAVAANRVPGIRVLGRVNAADKWSVFRGSDLYVLPSEDDRILGLSRWEEQTAISAIEAMQCGVPAVGSDSGALPDIIGLQEAIFQQGSVSALRNMLEKARDDPRWRTSLGSEQTQRARSEFDIRVAGRILSGTLDGLLQAS